MERIKMYTSKPKYIDPRFTVFGKPEGTGKRNIAHNEYLRTIPGFFGTDIDFVKFDKFKKKTILSLELKKNSSHISGYQRDFYKYFAELTKSVSFVSFSNIETCPMNSNMWYFDVEDLKTGEKLKRMKEPEYREFLISVS